MGHVKKYREKKIPNKIKNERYVIKREHEIQRKLHRSTQLLVPKKTNTFFLLI